MKIFLTLFHIGNSLVAETFPVEATEDKILDAAKGMLEDSQYFFS